MFSIEKINLTLSLNSFFFFLGLVLIAAYSVYVYRYTIPQVSNGFRFFLTSIRTLALILVLFAIFEPILNITRKKVSSPVNLIFVDNSKSIRIEDGTHRSENVLNFLSDLESNNLLKQSVIYSFGSKLDKIAGDSLEKINFSEGVSNFSKIFNLETDEQNIASVVMITDGVITDGTNPVLQAEKNGIPVYTIGVGDTSTKNNIEIKRILFNDFVYSETPTTITTTITNNGFAGKNIVTSLFESGNLIEQQNIILENESNNISFAYTPKTPGEKKLIVTVTEHTGEATYADNKKVFYIDVLNNKINTLILAGSPSPDLSFIKTTLTSDENLKVSSITQLNRERFIEQVNRNALIDSANILFLIGFPSQQTPNELLNKVISSIKDRNKPFFFIPAAGTDYNRLKLLQSELPFTIGRIINSYSDVQPVITFNENDNPLLKNNSNNVIDAWNNLPPVSKSSTELNAKPESDILAKILVRNIPINNPLILTRNIAGKKSIAILAKDVWRWKLRTASKENNLYDSFILNSVKWLNTDTRQKLVTIKTSKRLYSLGESIDFNAQVYDETFNPVDDADINVNVASAKEKYSVLMNSIGNGLYEGSLVTNSAGDYQFTGNARLNGKVLGNDAGKFSIGDVEIEFVNTSMDKNLLNLLSLQTGGKFFYGNDYQQVFDILKKNIKKKSNEKLIQSEFALWSNEWLLIIVIILFGLEWFLRKRSGML